MSQKNVLIIAPHPDDAEIFMGGTIAYLKSSGFNVTILDLTKGELSSRGTLEQRIIEKNNASEILNIDQRICANLPDGAVDPNPDQILALVTILREQKPDLVFAPYLENRHPDHLHAHHLVRESLFMANLKKYTDSKCLPPHSVNSIFWYMARTEFKPSFLVDISAFKEIKESAINAYGSQVKPGDATTHGTLVGSALSLHAINARDSYFGSMAGVKYAEPFYHDAPLLLSNESIFSTKQNTNSRFIYPS